MSFSGTVDSDFLKLARVEEEKKASLLDYTAQDFDSIKAALIKYIKAVYPLDFQNFNESDLGIMLAELFSYVGASNVFKADYNAHQNYIRVAKDRNAIKNLLQLVGVSMKGPISAAADARITFDSAVTGTGATIPAGNRDININSPEDGGSISYTLYKTVNGRVALVNNAGSIVLAGDEADNTASTVFSNLVLLEGALIKETGTFDSTELVKSIPLTQAPVVEGSVEVFIDGDSSTSGTYTKVENIFFASGSSDKVFQVVSDDDFAGTVVFGDNKLGQAPRDGDSYTVFYRVGGGSRGNIADSVINVSLPVGPPGTLENVSPGTGGSDAESVEHAKKYAPLTFRRQDRLVTLDDIKAFGNNYIGQFGNVGKVTASVRRAYSSANIIDVFVLEKASDTQLRRATPQFKLDLLESMNTKKMLTSEFVILDGLIRTLDLVVSLRVDKELRGKEEEIKLKARDAIQTFFFVDNNDFGKNLILEDLNRQIFQIDNVRFSTIDNLKSNIILDFNEIIQLNNLTINIILV